MKKLNINILLILALGLFAIMPVFAAVTTQNGKITATAEVSEFIAPDTAEISFSLETQDKNSQKAIEINNQKVSKLITEIKSRLTQGETVETTTYDLRPVYEYANKKSVQTGYTVTNTIKVTLKNLKKTGEIIKLAGDNGVSSVHKLTYSLQYTDSACKVLTQKAVAKAKSEAQNALTPLGKTVGDVYTMSYSCSTENSLSSRALNMAKMSTGADSDAIALETGQTKVKAEVTIVFTIK